MVRVFRTVSPAAGPHIGPSAVLGPARQISRRDKLDTLSLARRRCGSSVYNEYHSRGLFFGINIWCYYIITPVSDNFPFPLFTGKKAPSELTMAPRFFPILTVLLIFLSCSQEKPEVIIDPWWEKAFDGEGYLEKTLIRESVLNLRKISYKTVYSREEFQAEINAGEDENHVYIISPLLYSAIPSESDPEKKNYYILLNGFYDDPADNVIAVYSSRIEGYFEAGILAAEFSVLNDRCAVAAVFYEGSDVRKKERESFVRGFDSVADRGELIRYSQESYSAGDSLKSFISSAPEKGTGLFFFSASSLNPVCLEQALPLTIPISGENLNSLGLYDELIEFSVDDDMMRIVKTAMKLGLDGDIENDIPVSPVIRQKGIHF